MSRKLYLLAILVIGAASTASAQARPVVVARRDTAANNPYGLLVHVSGLLDDRYWLDKLEIGYTIQMHWKVQLWRDQFGPDSPQPAREWDTQIQAKSTQLQYSHVTRVPGNPDDPHVFGTLDSLKAWLIKDVPLGQVRLAPGDWYYVLSVELSALTPEDLEHQANGAGSMIGAFLQRLVLGGGTRITLPAPRIVIKVPR